MPLFADIGQTNRVENLFVADSVDVLPSGNYVAAHANVFVGCAYDPDAGDFVGVTPPDPALDPDPTPEPDPAPESAPAPRVSPVEFKLLFTATERVAVKSARVSDPVIADFFDILDDPRLTCVDFGLQSTREAVDYMIGKGLVAPERREAIFRGIVQ